AGLSAAFNLVQRLEPHLLQRQASALDLGPDIVTGARDGGMSRVLLAVNFSESQQANVGLDAYRLPPAEGTPVMRYRVAGATARVERAPANGQDAVFFAPGEAIVWLFARKTNDGPEDIVPPTVAIMSPLPDSTLTGEVELTAVAEDDTRIRSVEFFINGSPAGKAERAPYRTGRTRCRCAIRCNTTELKPDVWHRIRAVASDTTGNASEARVMLRVAEAGR
ncbi:MAG TPA: Ig-like domain-containing protein, partial [Armatimonadota bacterium]|nr:Ig-like domain-containing protein [Armatimonadota bacterium]